MLQRVLQLIPSPEDFYMGKALSALSLYPTI